MSGSVSLGPCSPCDIFPVCVFVREGARSVEQNSKVTEASLNKMYFPTMLNLALTSPTPTPPPQTHLFICGNLHSGWEHVKVSLGLIFTDFVPNCSFFFFFVEADCSLNYHHSPSLEKKIMPHDHSGTFFFLLNLIDWQYNAYPCIFFLFILLLLSFL